MNNIEVTSIIHASVLLNLGEKRILTDPWFSGKAYLFGRYKFPIGMKLEEIPPLDLIAISHNHADHLSFEAMKRFDRSATVLIPNQRTAKRIEKLGYKVYVLRPWESVELNGLSITATPAWHLGTQVGYIFRYEGKSVYFAGDSRLTPEMAAIRDRFAIDLALLPVNGFTAIGLGRLVMNPSEAVEAAKLVGARRVIPTHYHFEWAVPLFKGVMNRLVSGTPAEFEREAKTRGLQAEVIILNTGDTWRERSGSAV